MERLYQCDFSDSLRAVVLSVIYTHALLWSSCPAFTINAIPDVPFKCLNAWLVASQSLWYSLSTWAQRKLPNIQTSGRDLNCSTLQAADNAAICWGLFWIQDEVIYFLASGFAIIGGHTMLIPIFSNRLLISLFCSRETAFSCQLSLMPRNNLGFPRSFMIRPLFNFFFSLLIFSLLLENMSKSKIQHMTNVPSLWKKHGAFFVSFIPPELNLLFIK